MSNRVLGHTCYCGLVWLEANPWKIFVTQPCFNFWHALICKILRSTISHTPKTKHLTLSTLGIFKLPPYSEYLNYLSITVRSGCQCNSIIFIVTSKSVMRCNGRNYLSNEPYLCHSKGGHARPRAHVFTSTTNYSTKESTNIIEYIVYMWIYIVYKYLVVQILLKSTPIVHN